MSHIVANYSLDSTVPSAAPAGKPPSTRRWDVAGFEGGPEGVSVALKRGTYLLSTR